MNIALSSNITKKVAAHGRRIWHIMLGKDRTCTQRKLREKVTFEKTPRNGDVYFLFLFSL